ncbi:MAG: cation:proton antiporter [Sandaracinaceae bacterium]|nr:cation:proton antiporter [Sandaracinaceae bacterium]
MFEYLDEHLPLREPVEIFAVVLVLMLAAPLLGARLRLPGVVMLLLAGAVLGPNGILRAFGGLLARDASFQLLGGVGLIYIMFTAALEVDLVVFKKYRVQGAVFGILTFLIPQGIGTLMTHYVLGLPLNAAILMASMFASHTLLAYPVASRLGIGRSQAVTSTIGATMVTDVLALMVLAVIAGMAAGEVTEAFWWSLGVRFTIFVVAIMVGLPYLGRWFFRRMAKDGPGEFVFVLTSVFICAALSEAAGVEPIIGAFLAGLALNRLIPHSSTLMNRIVFTGDAIFVPFFVLAVGMLVDVTVIFGGLRTILIAVVMTGTVTLTKFLAAHAARIVFRFSSAEGQVMFGLSVPQAAATLAVVIVANRLGIFGDEAASAEVLNGTIVMILVTCILGPLVVDRWGRTVAAEEKKKAAEEEDEGGAPRILVPIVDPDRAKAPIDLALLVRGHGNVPLFPVFVAPDGENVASRVAQGEKMLAQVVSLAAGADVPCHPMTRVDDNVGAAIVRTRKERRINTILAGWDGRTSSEERVFGRVLDEALADRGQTLCVAYLPHEINTTQRVFYVVPPDVVDDPGFEEGVAFVKRLAKALGTPLVLMPQKQEEKQVLKAISDVKPSTKIESRPLETWSALVQALADRVGEHDMVVLFGQRGWDREDRGLPRRMVARFPQTNLVMVFGAEPSDAAATVVAPLADRPETRDALPVDHIVLGLEDLSGEEVLKRVYTDARKSWPNDRPPSDEALEKAKQKPRALGPDAVLIVHRDKQIAEPSIWLGVCRDGIEDADWPGKARLLFVAFVPESQDPSWHVDLVQALTRFAGDQEARDAAAEARSVDDCRAAIGPLDL